MKVNLPDEWRIPAQIRERLGDNAGRQRAMNYEGHLLLVLHAPPGPDDRSREGRLFLRSPTGSWACNTSGNVSNVLKDHIRDFRERADKLDEDLQAASCANDYFQILQAVAPLHRTARNLHTTLQQAREMIADDREIIVARDAAGDVERALELLHLDAKNGLDYTVASRAELQSERSYEMAASAHRLNLLAAVFFPITAISSIFGMNIASGLETVPGRWLFWVVLGVGFLSGLILSRMIAQPPRLEKNPEPPQKLVVDKWKKRSKTLPKKLQAYS
ncbi:MAG: CorA family divalent cation transporter [Candidatus Obscuribacterales bacterium]